MPVRSSVLQTLERTEDSSKRCRTSDATVASYLTLRDDILTGSFGPTSDLIGKVLFAIADLARLSHVGNTTSSDRNHRARRDERRSGWYACIVSQSVSRCMLRIARRMETKEGAGLVGRMLLGFLRSCGVGCLEAVLRISDKNNSSYQWQAVL